MRTAVLPLCPKPSGRFSSLSAKAEVLHDLLVLTPFLSLLLPPSLSHGAPHKTVGTLPGQDLSTGVSLQEPQFPQSHELPFTSCRSARRSLSPSLCLKQTPFPPDPFRSPPGFTISHGAHHQLKPSCHRLLCLTPCPNSATKSLYENGPVGLLMCGLQHPKQRFVAGGTRESVVEARTALGVLGLPCVQEDAGRLPGKPDRGSNTDSVVREATSGTKSAIYGESNPRSSLHSAAGSAWRCLSSSTLEVACACLRPRAVISNRDTAPSQHHYEPSH